MRDLFKNFNRTLVVLALHPITTGGLFASTLKPAQIDHNDRADVIICKKEAEEGYYLYGFIDGKWQAVFQNTVDDLVPDCDDHKDEVPGSI